MKTLIIIMLLLPPDTIKPDTTRQVMERRIEHLERENKLFKVIAGVTGGLALFTSITHPSRCMSSSNSTSTQKRSYVSRQARYCRLSSQRPKTALSKWRNIWRCAGEKHSKCSMLLFHYRTSKLKQNSPFQDFNIYLTFRML